MPDFQTILLRLLLVVLVGGTIGAERELRSKSAGFRTMILICLGSFLFTTFSMFITDNSPDRIASNIVTGIGFLGAGVIYRSDNRINGITTAATIWATAALGMGIAAGQYRLVLTGAVLVLASLFLLTKLESWIDNINQSRNYKIVSVYKADLLDKYEVLFHECRLRFKRIKQTKTGDQVAGSWMVHGIKKDHNRFIERILHDPDVIEFEF